MVLHIKKNHFLLLLWALLMAITTGMFAARFGVPQQFLMPEYRGNTNFVSFAIVGFALGGFIIGFNLYTYIMHGYRFPFIATLSRPFQKFTINNFILPAIFLITYIVCSVNFQMTREFVPGAQIWLNIAGLMFGVVLFLTISFGYFLYTNKNAASYAAKKTRRRRRKSRGEIPIESPIHQKTNWYSPGKKAGRWHVETYLFHFWKIALARESSHYSKPVLERVFAQNHINASVFEIMLVLTFIVIGTFRENEYFVIPAAASALLFFTMLLMLVSAVFSWIKGWTTTIFIVLIVVVNFFYTELRLIAYESRAFGMNYWNEMPKYPVGPQRSDSTLVANDIQNSTVILNNWLAKNRSDSTTTKPKLVIINCSGGGSRSAFWTMRSLMYADSVTGSQLLNHTAMVTGASGGMLGAAYLREIMWRESLGEFSSRHDSAYCEDLAKDLLNPIMHSISTNDWFIRFGKYHDGEYTYSKDRGYAFENQLNRNTSQRLDHRLSDYTMPELQAIIPMMILTPSIVNDGRRLVISSQPVSYLALPNDPQQNHPLQTEDIEFSKLYADQDAGNLKFTTALRMNATFPYILPMVTLPSDPPMDVMDAGIRDNFGLKTTLQFLYTFREWIEANTSGIVILQVRDLPKGVNLDGQSESLVSQFTAPLGSIYGNMTKTQDYNSFQMLRYLDEWFDNDIDMVTFQLPLTHDNFVSLSWHLTEAEKRTIRSATADPFFKLELDRLNTLLKE